MIKTTCEGDLRQFGANLVKKLNPSIGGVFQPFMSENAHQ
jgi:hypothetical protein